MQYDWIPSDQEIIWRVLGIEYGGPIDQKIYDEYFIRLAMKHKAGAPGPLGAVQIMNMLRFLGYKSKLDLKPQDTTTDWRRVEMGACVKVAPPGYPPFYGFYQGLCDMGTIAVQPEAGGATVEVPRAQATVVKRKGRPEFVSNESYDSVESMPTMEVDWEAKRAKESEGSGENFFIPVDAKPAELEPQEPGFQLPDDMQQSPSVPAPVDVPTTSTNTGVNWHNVHKGCEVLAMVGSAARDGTFHSYRENSGEVYVLMEGNDAPTSFSQENVVPNPM